MCLISKWRFPKIAKRDIVCYKILERRNGLYMTPYMDTVIEISKPLIAKGNSFSLRNVRNKGAGYIHTYTTRPMIPPIGLFHKPSVWKCIIPKGTKYHKSIHGVEYCSKQIIFIEKNPI